MVAAYPMSLRTMAVFAPGMFICAFVAALFVPLISDDTARIVSVTIAAAMALSLGLMSAVGFIGRRWARASRAAPLASGT